MNPVGASCTVGQVKQELLLSHSVGSSERGFLDASVNHFHFFLSYTYNRKAEPLLTGYLTF